MRVAIIMTLFISIVLVQCKSDMTGSNNAEPATAISDQELYDQSITTSGFTYYKNSDAYLASSPESAHNQFHRVRFNATAQAALTDNGKLPEGESFPEGSLIVKELHANQDGTGMNGIAIMIKRSNDPNAAENGWVWAEYFKSANDGFSVSTKGASCNGCHSTNDRDKVRLFNLVP